MGVANGLSPGPLLALVIAQTIRFGLKEGIKLSVSPLVGGIPVIVISLAIFKYCSNSVLLLGLISLIGAIFLFFVGIQNLRFLNQKKSASSAAATSLLKGALATILNPTPYAFWITVGAPLAFESAATGVLDIVGFLIAFFSGFILANIGIAYTASKTSLMMEEKIFRTVVRTLALILLIYGGVFLWNGIQKLSTL